MACYEKRCVVSNKKGLHARPSGLIVRLAIAELEKLGFLKKDFSRKVFVRLDASIFTARDASSILDFMILAAAQHQKLVVYTDYPKCRKLVDQVANLIDNMKEFDDD